MPYTSNPGGLFNSGVFPDSRPRIDVGSILAAVGQGTGSIIHSVLMRKQAENEMALRTAETNRANASVDLERQREAREAANQEREFGLRQESERHRFIEAGGIPAHTETQQVGQQTPITNVQPVSPIRRAMGAAPGASSSAAPGDMSALASPSAVQVTPGSAGEPVAPTENATVYHPENVDVPENYDPKRGAAYERGFMMADMRNQGFVTRDQARGEIQAKNQKAHDDRVAAMREAATRGAAAIAKMKVDSKTNSPIKSAALSAQAVRGRLAAAYDMIDRAGGSLDEAVTYLKSDDPAAKSLRDNGVDEYTLTQAHGQYIKDLSGQAVRLQSGAMGMEPNEAVGAVATTRKLVGAGKKAAPDGDTAAPGGTTAPASTPAPAAKPATKAPSLKAATPKPSAPKASAAPADDFSDDEIADAMKAGKTTDDDVRKFIVAQRQKKGGKK